MSIDTDSLKLLTKPELRAGAAGTHGTRDTQSPGWGETNSRCTSLEDLSQTARAARLRNERPTSRLGARLPSHAAAPEPERSAELTPPPSSVRLPRAVLELQREHLAGGRVECRQGNPQVVHRAAGRHQGAAQRGGCHRHHRRDPRARCARRAHRTALRLRACRACRACCACRASQPRLCSSVARVAARIADSTPFEGGVYKVKLTLPTDYPHAPPKGARARALLLRCCSCCRCCAPAAAAPSMH